MFFNFILTQVQNNTIISHLILYSFSFSRIQTRLVKNQNSASGLLPSTFGCSGPELYGVHSEKINHSLGLLYIRSIRPVQTIIIWREKRKSNV